MAGKSEMQPVTPPAVEALPPPQRVRRERIVRAALELLQSGEYDTIQMRDVAARAGVALGTLYRYFASKEHLYAAVMLVWFDSFERGLQREQLPDEPGPALKELLFRAIAAFARKPQFLLVEIVLQSSTDALAVGLFREFSTKNHAAYRDALAGLDPHVVERIAAIVAAVLGSALHQYALGRVDIEWVYDVVGASVDLVFSPPPEIVEGRITRSGAPGAA